MTRTMVGVFHERDDAIKVVEALKVLGYHPEDISVIVKDRHELKEIEEKSGTKLGEGLATGAVTGGFLGGLTGLLVGIGLLAIPGIGPVLAAGPIATTLGGAAIGAGALGLVGALLGMGIPEHEAHEYEKHVKNGDILVLVNTREDRAGQVMQTFRDHGTLSNTFHTSSETVVAPVGEKRKIEPPLM